MKRTITVLAGILTLLVGFGFPLAVSATPSYPDAHYAWADWKLRDNQNGTWLSGVAYSTLSPLTVNLRRPEAYAAPAGGPHYGASLENDNLNLDVAEGCSLNIDYTLLDGASPAAGAIRMFYYDTPYADTNNVAPTEFVAVPADSPATGTLSITFSGLGFIGAFGLVYDSSNGGGDSGIVSFTNLHLSCAEESDLPVVFENRTHVTPPTPVITDPSWVCGQDGWLLKLGSFTLPEAEGVQYNLFGDGLGLLDSVTVTGTDPGDIVWVTFVPSNGYTIDGDYYVKHKVPMPEVPESECPTATPTTTVPTTPVADPSESASTTTSPSLTTTTITASTTPVSGSLPVTGDGSGFVQKVLVTGVGLVTIGAVLLILVLRRRKQDILEQNV